MPLSKEQQQTLLDLLPTVQSVARQCAREHGLKSKADIENYEQEATAKVAEMLDEGKLTDPRYVTTAVQNHLSDYRLENKLIPHPKTSAPPNVIPLDFDIEQPSIDDLLDDVFTACRDDTDRTIVRLRNEGYTNHEIANQLGIASRTIRHRLQRIEATYDKERHRRSSGR